MVAVSYLKVGKRGHEIVQLSGRRRSSWGVAGRGHVTGDKFGASRTSGLGPCFLHGDRHFLGARVNYLPVQITDGLINLKRIHFQN